MTRRGRFLEDLFAQKRSAKENWQYWCKRIGTGTREEQVHALACEKEAFKKLTSLEQQIREAR